MSPRWAALVVRWVQNLCQFRLQLEEALKEVRGELGRLLGAAKVKEELSEDWESLLAAVTASVTHVLGGCGRSVRCSMQIEKHREEDPKFSLLAIPDADLTPEEVVGRGGEKWDMILTARWWRSGSRKCNLPVERRGG